MDKIHTMFGVEKTLCLSIPTNACKKANISTLMISTGLEAAIYLRFERIVHFCTTSQNSQLQIVEFAEIHYTLYSFSVLYTENAPCFFSFFKK
jgi:hypothetical protein